MLLRPYRLPDGTQIILRPIRPDDQRLLRAGFARLSPEAAQRRFLAPKPRLTSAELRYLTGVDGRDHVAIVAVKAHDPEFVVGVARFVRNREETAGGPASGSPAGSSGTPGASAEAAIVIGDPWQGMGLGRHMGLVLADLARERGITRFTATMLSDNRAAHRLFAAISQRLETQHHHGLEELVAELTA